MRGVAHHCNRFLCAVIVAVLYGALWAGTSAAQSDAERATGALPTAPHIALLLPLNAGLFVAHAQAVRDGFIAAAQVQGDVALPLRIYAATDDPEVTLAGYRQAVAAGARLVVGPLTRASVSVLAATKLVPVTTLALNAPDGAAALPPRMYVLTLQVDAEAKLVARLAYEEGHRRVYTVTGTDPLSQRMSSAFVEEFTRLGGVQADGRVYDGSELSGLEQYRDGIESSKADAAFLALDAARARAVRPYLGSVPVYGTSQIHPGSQSALVAFELNDVRFVGMPWLLQPDHPAVMVYPRPDYGGDLDLQRLYALGIDAFRVAQELLAGRRTFVLDGVTGGLRLGADRVVHRAQPVAQLTDGRLTLIGEVRP